jgi:hypothetical protein
MTIVTGEIVVARKGRPPRVPNERRVYLRVYFAESEFARVRAAATRNGQPMSVFARLAVSDAAEESGAEPIVAGDRRATNRRRRPGDDQPVELDRRRGQRRCT